MRLLERRGRTIEGVRVKVEKPIQRWIEKHGFIPLEEEPSVAMQARIDTLRASWALKGFDHLLEFDEQAGNREQVVYRNGVERLVRATSRNYDDTENPRMQALMRRFMGVRHRRKLLMDTLYQATIGNTQQYQEARRRLGMVLDIIDDRIKKPDQDGHKAVILTQTAYLLGNENQEREKRTAVPYGFGEWVDAGIQIASGTLPYLGAAVVYSELMATGKFSDIDIIDFRNKKSISEMLARGDRTMAFVSGATTYDGPLIDRLNRQLSEAGMTVVNGGVASGIDPDPQRYLDNGTSVFVGDFEGAADQLVQELEEDPVPKVFVRGGNRAKQLQLIEKRVQYKAITGLSKRADVTEAYSVERERDGSRLANRLIALEMMRPYVEFAGKKYDTSPFFRIHETSVSYGCPEACSFCATVPLQGKEMRKRSIASLRQEWEAIDTPHIAIVDQNFLANGREYVENVLRLAEELGKQVAFEGELLFFLTAPPGVSSQNYFFDGSPDDAERERLLKKVVLGIEVGLEQPVKVRGTIKNGKDPKHFSEAQQRLNDLGVVTFGTGVIGMPKELWAPGEGTDLPVIPYTELDEAGWDTMIATWLRWFEDEVPSPGALPFTFTVIPGTAAYKDLNDRNLLEFEKENPHPTGVKGIDAEKALEELRDYLYSWRSIRKRVGSANFNQKRRLFMYIFNLTARIAFRQTMN